MTSPTEQRRAFDAAMDSYRSGDRATALGIFTRVTADNPAMSDAWLGRLACGDQELDTLAGAHENSRALYRETRRIGLKAGELHAVIVAPLYLTLPVWSRATLALAYASRAESDRLEAFWAQVMRLRDLLKFDFYFADSAAFRAHVAEEMSWHDDWESDVAAGGERIDAVLRVKRPTIAGPLLRPFFEAYQIVADALIDAPADISEKDLTAKALGLGQQYVAQGRVQSNESVSALLFTTARQVAADHHLLEPAADLEDRRTAFRNELRGILADMNTVDRYARKQFVARERSRRQLRERAV